MENKSLGQSLVEDTAAKASLFGPAIAGAVALGPVGFFVGLAVSVLLMGSTSDSTSPPPTPPCND